MDATFTTDALGRLICDLSHLVSHATVTSSDAAAAAAGLRDALDSVALQGTGECFWPEAGGDYRWMFRKEDGTLTLVVLWSSGTLTGWEHVFWGQADLEPFTRLLLDRLSGVTSTARPSPL